MRRDRHLNLFHNYNNEHIRGKAKKKENVETQGRGIIEDNVTRAFVLFLDFLKRTGKLQDFLICLPKEKMGTKAHAALKKIKTPQFDLQNLDNRADHKRVREADVLKVLMIITTVPYHLESLNDSEVRTNTTDPNEQTEKAENENRADAWILQKKDKGDTVEVAVLIEAKIGNNPISTKQLLRHLGREKFGFNIPSTNLKEFCDTNVINLTWRDINKSLEKFEKSLEKFETLDQAVNYFTSNLKEYILMSNGDVDIKNLLKEDTDSIERKQIFAHILGKVNEKMKHHFENTAEGTTEFKMSGRPLAGLWDYWGIPDGKGDAKRSPHISLGLNDEFMLIGFDTYNMSQKSRKRLEASLSNGKIADYIKTKLTNPDQKETLYRYKLSLIDERLWDWKKGQIQGEMYDKFRLEFDFDFLLRQSGPEGVGAFLKKSFAPYLNMGIKRFSVFYTLRLPNGKLKKFDNAENPEIIREDQKLVKLFKDEKELIDLLYNQIIEFYEFVEEMK